MKNKLPIGDFDGFSVVLFKEDKPSQSATYADWTAHLKELPQVTAYGKTIIQSLHALSRVWEVYKESCLENNQPIPKSNLSELSII